MADFKLNPAVLQLITEAGERAVADAAEYLLETANRKIPKDTGTMERSGSTDQDGLRASVYYDTPYAARQHEDTRLQHAPGREAKWLERAADREADRIGQYIADSMRRRL